MPLLSICRTGKFCTFLDWFSDIDDLEPLVDLLAQFQGLEELNLSNNLFTQLPSDLSTWQQVANLNLSNIQFDDFEACVSALATIPNLKSLYVNLFEESQVDLIMRILPDLEFLNGLPVDRDALNESIHSSQQKHRGQVDEIPEEEAEADENTQQLTEQSRVEVEPTLNTYQSA